MLRPVLDLLNISVVNSAIESDNFLPCTTLFNAY